MGDRRWNETGAGNQWRSRGPALYGMGYQTWMGYQIIDEVPDNAWDTR